MDVARDVAAGLKHMHTSAGIVHCDVRVGNIVIVEGGGGDRRAVLVDLGNAVDEGKELQLKLLGDCTCLPNSIVGDFKVDFERDETEPTAVRNVRFKRVHDLISLVYTVAILVSGHKLNAPWDLTTDALADSRRAFLESVCVAPVSSNQLSSSKTPCIGTSLLEFLEYLHRVEDDEEALTEDDYNNFRERITIDGTYEKPEAYRDSHINQMEQLARVIEMDAHV
jgi:hypothetical protein